MGTLLWVWIVLDSEVCSVSLPEITDAKFMDDCVSEHNEARSSVNPPASNMLYMVGMGNFSINKQKHVMRKDLILKYVGFGTG